MFLQDSARMLFLSSPSTSRHLSAQRIELVQSETPQRQLRVRDVCTACGTLLVSAWTTETKSVTTRIRLPQNGNAKPKKVRHRTTTSRCSACNRVTKDVVEVPPIPRQRQTKPVVVDEMKEEAIPHEEPVTEQSSKVTSKKRAKARKDRQGLQALLSKSSQNKPSRSLNLTDLMKR